MILLKIDVNKLSVLYSKMISLLNNYEKLYCLFYREINNVESYWHNCYANAFFNNINNEKKENDYFYEEFKSICDLYNYIIKEYLKIGNKIEFNAENQDSVFDKFNNYINFIDDIIEKYNRLSDTTVFNLNENLNKEKIQLIDVKKKLSDIRLSNKELSGIINENEKKIKLKISNVDIKMISKNSTILTPIGNTKKSYFDENGLEISIKKLDFYIKEEEVIFDDFKKIVDNMKCFYVTYNKESLNKLITSFCYKFNIIINNHKNSVIVLRNNLDKLKKNLKIIIKNIKDDTL